MSTKNIFFFENGADEKLSRLYKNHDDINVRRLPRCLIPSEMDGFSAYTLDDHHENFGVCMMYLNSDSFRDMYSEVTEIPGKDFSPRYLWNAEENEKCALEIKHIIFEIMLCCGIKNVGVTSLGLSDDAAETDIDLRGFSVKYVNIWDLKSETLLSLEKETVLIIYKND